MNAVSLKSVGHRYKNAETLALDGLDLTIPEGSFYGLLGPNGAGKTTTISIISGIIHPKSGSVEVFGNSWAESKPTVKQTIGLVPQEIALFDTLTAVENLLYFGSMAGIESRILKERIQHYLELFGLTKHRKKQLRHFSGGMKRRVNLIAALLHDPKVLILDEPTVGIDVHSRHLINKHLKDLNKKGVTIIYTSHQLDEAQHLCNRVCIIDSGAVVIEDSVENLIEEGETLHDVYMRITGHELRDL